MDEDVGVDGGGTDNETIVDDQIDDDQIDAGAEEDLAYLIGQGRFVAASTVVAHRTGVDRATRAAGSGVRRVLERAARVIHRRRRLLQVLAGAAAGVSAVATFVAIFVVELPIDDGLTGPARSVTVWSAGLRITSGGSYGLILAVVAPAALAVTLLAQRWWRPTLVAVTVYSVHWLTDLADVVRFERAAGEAGVELTFYTWQLWGLVALAVALVLGGALVAASPAGRSSGRPPRHREVALVAAGLVLWALTWRRPQMVFVVGDLEQGSEQRSETLGPMQGFPLNDLGLLTDHPLDFLIGYLPALLVAAVSVSMILGRGRMTPHVRVGVWAGAAIGVLADVVQRSPIWYDPDPSGWLRASRIPAELLEPAGTWTPATASFLLLLGAAVAFVSAAWAARVAIEEVDETGDETQPGERIEVFDLDASPLGGERP